MSINTLKDYDLNLEKLADELRTLADRIEKHEETITKLEISQTTEIDSLTMQEISLEMVASKENLLKTEDLYFLHDE